MKNLLLKFTVFVLILAGLVISCNVDNSDDPNDPKNPNDPKLPEEELIASCGRTEINAEEYLQLCVVPSEVSVNSTNKLVIENKTSQGRKYGTDFSLQYFSEGQWKPVRLNGMFSYISCSMQSNSTAELDFSIYQILTNCCPDFQEGKYRVNKEVGGYKLSAEFIVKKENL